MIARIVESEVEKSLISFKCGCGKRGRTFQAFRIQQKQDGMAGEFRFYFVQIWKTDSILYLKRITIINDGVGIQTEKDTKVKAVFEGVVSTIAAIESMNNIVIVQAWRLLHSLCAI